jgi:hypothetical protein
MPTANDVRRIALALPEAYADEHRGKPAFRVNRRIFAMLGVPRPGASPGFFAPLSGARPVASVTIEREDQLNFAAAWPEGFEDAGAYGFSWVWLDAIAPDALAMLIRMSWTKAAPRRLLPPRAGWGHCSADLDRTPELPTDPPCSSTTSSSAAAASAATSRTRCPGP